METDTIHTCVHCGMEGTDLMVWPDGWGCDYTCFWLLMNEHPLKYQYQTSPKRRDNQGRRLTKSGKLDKRYLAEFAQAVSQRWIEGKQAHKCKNE